MRSGQRAHTNGGTQPTSTEPPASLVRIWEERSYGRGCQPLWAGLGVSSGRDTGTFLYFCPLSFLFCFATASGISEPHCRWKLNAYDCLKNPRECQKQVRAKLHSRDLQESPVAPKQTVTRLGSKLAGSHVHPSPHPTPSREGVATCTSLHPPVYFSRGLNLADSSLL